MANESLPSCSENLTANLFETVFHEMLLGILQREKCPVFKNFVNPHTVSSLGLHSVC